MNQSRKNRVWVGSLALRAYPPGVQSARSEEMLGTLLDAGEDSDAAFIRGWFSLVFSGVCARAGVNAQAGTKRLIADGFCLGAVLWSAYELLRSIPISHPYAHVWPPLWLTASLTAVIVLGLLRYDRLAGVCGLLLLVMVVVQAEGSGQAGGETTSYLFSELAAPAAYFAVMVLKPRVGSHNPRRLLWLIALAALVFAPPTLAAYVFLFATAAIGIFLLPADPRLAVASAALWVDTFAPRSLTLPVLLLALLLTASQVTFTRRYTRV